MGVKLPNILSGKKQLIPSLVSKLRFSNEVGFGKNKVKLIFWGIAGGMRPPDGRLFRELIRNQRPISLLKNAY